MLRWNLSRALIVTRREVIDMGRDWRILIPILILTLVFPSIANWGGGRMISWIDQFGANLVAERLFPFLLLVVGFFPMSFSLIIALESFVGEKERRSLEPLFSTPLTNSQLYLGKMLSSVLAPLGGSLLGITVYLVGLYFNVGWVPELNLLMVVLALTILQAMVMVAGAVILSSQATSVRAANLLASFIILPIAFLIQAESFILFWANYRVLWLFVIGLIVVVILLVRMGMQVFNREELLGREMDDLNLGAIFKQIFVNAVARSEEGGRSVWRWYQKEVLGAVKSLWREFLLILIIMVAAYFVGVYYSDVWAIPADAFVEEGFAERFQDTLTQTGFGTSAGFGKILYQNVRALALTSLLGVFTFGILAIMVLFVPMGLIGYLVPQLAAAGLDLTIVWAALLPHSIFEIPAAILAGAVALRLGSSIIAPPPGKTLGEGWLIALGSAVRLWWTLILPLLILAALVETFITPEIVLWLIAR